MQKQKKIPKKNQVTNKVLYKGETKYAIWLF